MEEGKKNLNYEKARAGSSGCDWAVFVVGASTGSCKYDGSPEGGGFDVDGLAV